MCNNCKNYEPKSIFDKLEVMISKVKDPRVILVGEDIYSEVNKEYEKGRILSNDVGNVEFIYKGIDERKNLKVYEVNNRTSDFIKII